MRASWSASTTAELIDLGLLVIGDGYRAKNSEFGDSGLPFLRIGNIGDNGVDVEGADLFPVDSLDRVGSKISRTGDCAIATKATIGRLAFMSAEVPRVVYSPQVSYWRVLDRDSLEPHFIRYWLQGREFQDQAQATKGSTAMADYISLRDQRSMRITIPDITEQRRIGAVLSAYDDLIANNARRIAILEDMARTIYREWFVEFRYPGHEGVPLVESELGPIPEGWGVARVDEIADLHRGRSYRSTNLVDDGGWPFINLKCFVRDGGFRSSGLKRYDGPLKEHQRATAGDVVIALTDMTQDRRIIAGAARVPDLGVEEFAMSMDVLKVRPKSGVPDGFLYGMLRYSSFSDEVKEYANGANVLHLSPDRIREYTVVLPPTSLQKTYSSIADNVEQLRDVLSSQTRCLERTRNLLLPRLVSGEVDVSDLDIDVGVAS